MMNIHHMESPTYRSCPKVDSCRAKSHSSQTIEKSVINRIEVGGAGCVCEVGIVTFLTFVPHSRSTV
jgi:hypothetical protein